MARLMSVAYTEQASERRKTATRRKGWRFSSRGSADPVSQVMGRKPGEPLVRLADVEVEWAPLAPRHAHRLPLCSFYAIPFRLPWCDWEAWRKGDGPRRFPRHGPCRVR